MCHSIFVAKDNLKKKKKVVDELIDFVLKEQHLIFSFLVAVAEKYGAV